MDHGLHDAPLLEGYIVVQLHRVQHRANWNALPTDPFHRLELCFSARPGANDLVYFRLVRRAVMRREVAFVANQILAPDHFQQPVPVFRVRRAGRDIDVVIRPSGALGNSPLGADWELAILLPARPAGLPVRPVVAKLVRM